MWFLFNAHVSTVAMQKEGAVKTTVVIGAQHESLQIVVKRREPRHHMIMCD